METPDGNLGRQRRRFGRFVLILFGAMLAAQVPLLIFLGARGVALWRLGLGFVALNALLVIRMWYVPQPYPPPVWFERYAVWPYFAVTVSCLYFAPGAVVAWALAMPPSWIWGWLACSAVLGAIAVGVPWRRVVIRRFDVPVAGLPPGLHGLTIVQLSDLHVGPMASERRVRSWVRRANALGPDVVALTGDLIATGDRFVPALERALGGLTPRLGTWAVMGNHDYFSRAGDAVVAMHDRLGHRLLRNDHLVLDAGGGGLVVAGIDDTWRALDDLDAALRGAPGGSPVVLLAHDPEVFPAAADRGVCLQLSGHTHGGQIAIPFVGRRGAIVHYFGVPWIQGAYRRGAATLVVSAGLGTTGAPIRIGMPSEIPVIRLVAA